MSQEDIDKHNNSLPSESPQGNEEINPNQQQEENKENEQNEENKENEENNEEEKNEEGKPKEPEEEPFSYLEERKCDNFKEIVESQPFVSMNGNFKYCICILMEKNDSFNSISLKQTLRSIGANLNKLKDDIGIIPQEISIFIFVNEIVENNNLFKKENEASQKEENINDFIIKEWEMNVDKEEIKELANIKIYSINKLKYFYPIKCLSTYYDIINQIKAQKKMLFSSILTAGIIFSEDKLIELIRFAYHSKKKHGVAIPSIEYKESNLVSKLCTYEKKRFNLYHINFLNGSNVAPISSQLSTITINDNNLKTLINYYKTLDNYSKATIDYHDYNLALYLRQKKYLIKYINGDPVSIHTRPDFSFYDYQQIYINRFSGYYGNFFQILSSFSNGSPLQAIFLVFQLISIFFEFILPSVASMIIYIIFYSAFKTTDYKISLFFTLLYLCLMFISGYCSIIGKKIEKIKHTYFILNILMTVLYFLALICSIPAMHFAHEDENPDLSGYEFDKAAISLIIIFTFIPYIVPLLLNISNLKGDIVMLLVYNLICAPLAKINFNVAAVLGASDVSGGLMVKERKSFYILFYLGFNLFISGLSFYNTDNKKKANCVMGFAIIYLIFNFLRTLAIIIEISFKKEESFDSQALMENIKDDLNNEVEGEVEVEEEDKKSQEQNNQNEENEGDVENMSNNDNNNDNINNEEQNDADGREVEVEQNE